MLRRKLLAYVQLSRPANIITAVADVLAGFAASGAVAVLHPLSFAEWVAHSNFVYLGWLALSTVGLYGGGIVFNFPYRAG